MIPDLQIRAAASGGQPEIFEIVQSAFGRDSEALLVERLQKSEAYIPELSLVSSVENQIVGHILFTSIKIVADDGEEWKSLALAPLAVRPDWQNKGVGSGLVRRGLDMAKSLGHASAIVLGHPNYYPRFGFEPARKWGIWCPFPVSDEAFMGIELQADALKGVSGLVVYDRAFNDL
jgi:putative acetyltransferase